MWRWPYDLLSRSETVGNYSKCRSLFFFVVLFKVLFFSSFRFFQVPVRWCGSVTGDPFRGGTCGCGGRASRKWEPGWGRWRWRTRQGQPRWTSDEGDMNNNKETGETGGGGGRRGLHIVMVMVIVGGFGGGRRWWHHGGRRGRERSRWGGGLLCVD